MTAKRPAQSREFGHDGITVVVDADRALRVREIRAEPTSPNKLQRGLLARINGRFDDGTDSKSDSVDATN